MTSIIHHREACAIRDAACLAYDNSDENEECAATKIAHDYMLQTVGREQAVLAKLMSTVPTSVAELAALILHVDEYNRQQDAFGADTEGRTEILIARLTQTVGLIRIS